MQAQELGRIRRTVEGERERGVQCEERTRCSALRGLCVQGDEQEEETG
jgi:hypothetical protein